MAEVKQVIGSFSLSSSTKKKPPTFSNNGVSSSFKNIYDDVFASSSPNSKVKPSNSYMEDDYAEVFGSSKSNNGCWSISYSSIPIIDLPKEKDKDFASSRKGGERVDFSGVFGGIDDDSFGLPNGEELFDHLNKKAKFLPRSEGQRMKTDIPGISSQSYEQLPANGVCRSFDNTKRFESGKFETTNATHARASSVHEVGATQKTLPDQTASVKDAKKSPTNGFFQSSDNAKHFELRDSEITADVTSGPRKAAHVRAYSSHEVSATHKTMSNQTPVIKNDGKVSTNGFCQSTDNVKHSEPGHSEMMVNAKNGSRNAGHIRTYSLHEVSTQKAMSSQTSASKDDGKSSTNGFCQSSDSMKPFETGDSKMIANAKSGPINAAHVRAYSLHEVSNIQKSTSSLTPVIKGDTLDADSNAGKKEGKHSRHTSLEVGANKQFSDGDAGLQKASGMSESNSFDRSHGTYQPSKAATNEFCQSSDNTKHSEYKTNDMKTSQFSGGTHAAEVHPIHESNHAMHELGPTQKTMSSRTSVLNDETRPIDVDVGEDQGKHSHDTSLDFGARTANRQNGECDKIRESTSFNTSRETCQASFEATPSKVVNDDAEIAMGSGKVKKKGRRSRMTSLDLSDYNHSSEHEGGSKRKPRFGSSYSFDASHDPSASHVKVQPSKMYPSSSMPQFFPVESHYKISANSSFKNSQKNMYRGGVDSPPSLAEELDVNSAAAVSAAALQRAIEEAEMRIRWAKAFLEREGHGSTKLRFKDTLKVCVATENGLANEVNNFRQTEMDDSYSSDESEMKPCSPLKQNHVTTHAQEAPPFETQKKFVNDGESNGEFTEVTDAKVSDSIREDEKGEGGEWEAAKHLNQIISGVKNKIVSFMSWQTETETEKKESLKEIETNMKHQQHPEEVEHDLKDHELFEERGAEKNQGTTTRAAEAMHVEDNVEFASEAAESEENESIRGVDVNQEKVGNKVDVLFEERGAEKNQGTTTSAAEAMHVEDNVEFASEAVESEENESIRGVDANQEKVGNKVDVTPNTAEPSLPFLQFFAFRNQRLCDPPDSEIEEKVPEGSGESEIENEQEQVVNEVEDERLPCQGEEASLEGLYDNYVNQDNKMQDHMSDMGLSTGEFDKTVEVTSFFQMPDVAELSHEEHRQDDMNREGDLCFMNEESVEMVKELNSFAGHQSKELTNEMDGQDDMCRKSHTGFVNEESVEIVQEPYSVAGHDTKSFTDEEGGQDDVITKRHLGSNNKENDEIVEEFYTPSGHERTDVAHEDDNDNCLNEECEEEPLDHSIYFDVTTDEADKYDECEVLNEAEQQHKNADILEDIDVVADTLENLEAAEGVYGSQGDERDEIEINHIEEVSEQKYGSEESKPIQAVNIEETVEQVTVQASCVASAEEGCKQNHDVLLNKDEETSKFVESSSEVEDAVYPDEVIEKMIDMTNSSSEPEIDIDIPVSAQTEGELIREEPEVTSLSTVSIMEVDKNKMEDRNGAIENFQCETFVSVDSDTDMSSEEDDVDVQAVEPHSQDNLENQTDFFDESREKLHVEEYDTASDQELEMSGVEAVHRRRRWFDSRGSTATAERPSILEGNPTDSEMDQEALDESELTGSVEIHADKLDCSAAEVVATARDAELSSNLGCSGTNAEVTPKRRRWFVKRGEEGVPEPLSLFEGVKVNLEAPLESKNETLLHKDISGSSFDQLNTNSGESLKEVKSDAAVNGDIGKQSGEAAPRRKRWFEGRERVEPVRPVRIDGDVGMAVELDQESEAKGDDAEKHVKPGNMPIPQEKDDVHYRVESKEQHSDMDEVNRREKAREKEKLAVERAIREARERAFSEARERARRDAAEKPNAEARPKVAAGVQEKLGKVSSEGTSSSDKASVEAKLKAERAAVERATAEARERALQKSLSEKAFPRSREQSGKYSTERSSSMEPKYQSSRSSTGSNNSDADVESAQRRKARLERQKRTTERAAKALEEKNKRDLVTQKEQAAKNMLADALDAEVRRWSAGKEGNLRALLSTLQYILGPDSGWQPVSLTDLVAATSVRKAYKKATLCVHPDKLQQRGASIQQKHICEKVFDLLKEAWSKFNPDER